MDIIGFCFTVVYIGLLIAWAMRYKGKTTIIGGFFGGFLVYISIYFRQEFGLKVTLDLFIAGALIFIFFATIGLFYQKRN